MTISNTSRIAGPFLGNGSTTDFPFGFKVFSASDMQVVKTVVATGVDAELVLNLDYYVTLNPDQNANPGGVIKILTAPELGSTVVFTSDVDATQTLDLTNSGGFYPTVINNAFDRVVILIQQIKGTLARTVRFPLSDGSSISVLPSAGLRAGKLLGFDASGNFTAVIPSDGSAAGVFSSLSAGSGSSLLGFLAASVGAIKRTMQDKMRETVSVTDNMSLAQIADSALASPTIDVTAMLQSIHDGFPDRGGCIEFPPGTFMVNGVVFTKPIKLLGKGQMATIIKTSSAVADVITMKAFCSSVQDIGFDSSVVRTAGSFINMSGSWYSAVTNVRMSKYYLGISIDSAIHVNVKHVSGIDGTASSVAANGALVRVGETGYCGGINLDSLEADVNDATKQPSFGILVRFVDVMTIKNSLIVHHGANLKIAPYNNQFSALIYGHGNTFDTAGRGIHIQPATGGRVLRLGFDSTWTGENTLDGVCIDGTAGTVDGVSFTGLLTLHNGQIGANILGTNAKNILFSGNSRAVANGGSGLQLTQNCNAVWDGGILGASDGSGGNLQGAAIEAGCSGALRNANLSGNTNTPISNSSPTMFFESGNTPYEWSPVSPSISATTGSVTSSSLLRYKRVNKNVFFTVTVNITTSTGAGALIISLPFTTGPSGQTIAGRETLANGKQVQGVIPASSSSMLVYNYDGTYPGAPNSSITLSGVVETV